jgi:hypothetical protein
MPFRDKWKWMSDVSMNFVQAVIQAQAASTKTEATPERFDQ